MSACIRAAKLGAGFCQHEISVPDYIYFCQHNFPIVVAPASNQTLQVKNGTAPFSPELNTLDVQGEIMSETSIIEEANTNYDDLKLFASRREEEISSMLTPYSDVTDKYGRLLSRICVIVGNHEPKSIQDAVLRDLMADVFDFLREANNFILRGQTLVAYPLARRAYESLSLMHWCALDESAAESWFRGKQVGNHEIRKALAKQPIGESEHQLKEMYNFFCKNTHPNREMIGFRGLGEGNRYVFGSIGAPNLVELADYCMKSLDLWFWFCPVAVWSFKEMVFDGDDTFNDTHNAVRDEAQSVMKWLGEQYNHVLEEWKNDNSVIQPKYI